MLNTSQAIFRAGDNAALNPLSQVNHTIGLEALSNWGKFPALVHVIHVIEFLLHQTSQNPFCLRWRDWCSHVNWQAVSVAWDYLLFCHFHSITHSLTGLNLVVHFLLLGEQLFARKQVWLPPIVAHQLEGPNGSECPVISPECASLQLICQDNSGDLECVHREIDLKFLCSWGLAPHARLCCMQAFTIDTVSQTSVTFLTIFRRDRSLLKSWVRILSFAIAGFCVRQKGDHTRISTSNVPLLIKRRIVSNRAVLILLVELQSDSEVLFFCPRHALSLYDPPS